MHKLSGPDNASPYGLKEPYHDVPICLFCILLICRLSRLCQGPFYVFYGFPKGFIRNFLIKQYDFYQRCTIFP